MSSIILIRGGGDLASGVAIRLHRAQLKVVILEVAQPLTVRRSVAFSEAVYEGQAQVEDVRAVLAASPSEVHALLAQGVIPVLIDAEMHCLDALRPAVLVDARMKKREVSEQISTEALRIGLGPGFIVGLNCDVVIETMRGHALGRPLWAGSAAPDTGIPGAVLGISSQRVVRAPVAGCLEALRPIGTWVEQGEVIARVGTELVLAPISGLLRGMAHSGLTVFAGMKIGDVDPRRDPDLHKTVSDKALAIGGGVLEAMLSVPGLPQQLWEA